MKLAELFDLSGMEQNAERLKKNAKRQADAAKAAQARLKMLKAQKQLRDATRDTSSESRF
jgi:ribosome-binding ATPase YchF (GTP1/OBG family)